MMGKKKDEHRNYTLIDPSAFKVIKYVFLFGVLCGMAGLGVDAKRYYLGENQWFDQVVVQRTETNRQSIQSNQNRTNALENYTRANRDTITEHLNDGCHEAQHRPARYWGGVNR